MEQTLRIQWILSISMIHYITEGGNGNKELKTHRWFLPDGIRHHLEKVKDNNKKEELSKNHTTKEAWDHLEFILGEEKGISYQEMKRMKNWFDKNHNATKTKQYELYGGNIMKTWVENQLNSATLWVKKHKEAQRAMGKENAFIKPHEADRQNVVSKVDTKVPTYNPATLNKQNRLKELGELKENKTIIITENQRKQLQEVISGKTRSNFFNELETYASAEDFSTCQKLCSEYFGKPMDSGSSRIIYRIDDEKILKLGYNKKGIAQNKTEVECYNRTKIYKDIFPIVFSWSENYTYIISEYVLPLMTLCNTNHDGNEVDDLYNCLGVTEDTLTFIKNIIRRCIKGNTIDWDETDKYSKGFRAWLEQFMSKNKNFDLLMCYMIENPELVNESFSPVNLGMAKRNGKPWIVILDNGWDGEVAKLYNYPNFGSLNV